MTKNAKNSKKTYINIGQNESVIKMSSVVIQPIAIQFFWTDFPMSIRKILFDLRLIRIFLSPQDFHIHIRGIEISPCSQFQSRNDKFGTVSFGFWDRRRRRRWRGASCRQHVIFFHSGSAAIYWNCRFTWSTSSQIHFQSFPHLLRDLQFAHARFRFRFRSDGIFFFRFILDSRCFRGLLWFWLLRGGRSVVWWPAPFSNAHGFCASIRIYEWFASCYLWGQGWRWRDFWIRRVWLPS